MARIESIEIENFRSIGEEPLLIDFPKNSPLILVGENNAGKSNIIRAIELIFGEYHPKYKSLDDFDYFERNPKNKITINAKVTGIINKFGYNSYSCGGFYFTAEKNKENEFLGLQNEDGVYNKYVSNLMREELICVSVNSEQNLSYQLSYSSKFTLLSKVTKAFHEKLSSDEEKVNRLKAVFETIKQTFLEVDEFRLFSENMSHIAGQMITNMSHALNFDFSAYDPSNYYKTLRVHPAENGEIRTYEELGTGQQQILALTFAHAYAKSFLGQGIIFILDEPESHLHPLAQKWLANQMYKMAEDGLQLVITTHSPYFINLEYLSGVYIVSKDIQTRVSNTNASNLVDFCHATGAPKADEKTILPFYSAHSKPSILNGFFAKKIILVEGETEELALPYYFQKVGLDTLKEGIAVIGVGGKSNLSKWWRLFKILNIPVFICFDNDDNGDSKKTSRKEALKAIGIDDGEIASLLTCEDWNINENFCVFGVDFEKTMKSSFLKYQEFEDQEKSRLGNSKPIVARAVAKLLFDLEICETDTGWEKFNDLKKMILELC
jgi:putative ATP-dependent endonuclease of OLD family